MNIIYVCDIPVCIHRLYYLNIMYDNCIDYLLTASQICYSFVSRCSSYSDNTFVKVVDPVDAADIDQTEHTDVQGQRIQLEEALYIYFDKRHVLDFMVG